MWTKVVAYIFTMFGILFWSSALFGLGGTAWGPSLLIAGAILFTNTAIMMTINKEKKDDSDIGW